MFLRSLRNWIALGCITVLLTACGGGSGGGNSASPAGGSSGTSNGGTSSSGSNSGTTAPTPTALTYGVQLNWTAPVTRADGTPLTSSELTGYRIYYSLEGSDASQDKVVPVSGGNTTALQVTLSAAGTYAFAITALDQNGLESALSTPVSVAVN